MRKLSAFNAKPLQSRLYRFLKALNKHNVDYILVGGYAVILHGYERVTADIDIWVRSTSENYEKLTQAFRAFGMPMFDMTLNNFLDVEKWDVFRFGRKPVAIDIMTKAKGLTFEEAFLKSEVRTIDVYQFALYIIITLLI